MSKALRVMSKNLKGSTELTLIANIKPGLVQLSDPMSHATRLKKLLGILFESRKTAVERGGGFVGPLERLRSIHFVRWSVIDEGQRLLLAVSFDRPWEPYIQLIVDEAGPILDAIFSHCEGYDDHSTRHGYDKFAEWVRGVQVHCDFFFSAYPGVTVDDIRYLQQLKRTADDSPPAPYESVRGFDPLEIAVGELEGPRPGPAEYANFYATVVGLYRLRSYFPENVGAKPNYSDRAIYDRACAALLRGFDPNGDFPDLPKPVAAQYSGLSEWCTSLRVKPAVQVGPPEEDAKNVQPGILKAHHVGDEQMTHGCVVLIEFGANPEMLIERLEQFLTASSPEATRYNVGFTPSGLEKLGVTDDALTRFPPEFLQGMAARAGLLGDIGSNHPGTWNLPRLNVEENTDEIVRLSSVDAVVILQKHIPQDLDGDPSLSQDHVWSAKHPLADDVKRLGNSGDRLLHVVALRRYRSMMHQGKYREHFGFLDGFSQPEVRGALAEHPVPVAQINEVTRGEVLLGHTNDRGERTAGSDDPLLKNGSFLVLRKLSQNVEAFTALVAQDEALPAKLMGRTVDGVPLTNTALGTSSNAFDYAKDSGARCPLQAHTRLANPRTADKLSAHGVRMRTPRILRRGFSYGPPHSQEPGAERGVLFMAYNASIAQQYEVVQRWLNGANSTGLDSSHRDALTGPIDADGNGLFRYRDAHGTSRKVSLPSTPLVKLEWGMYLFVPSLSGLSVLRGEKPAPSPSPSPSPTRSPSPAQSGATQSAPERPVPPAAGKMQRIVAKGLQLLARLETQQDPVAWRLLLEEQGAREEAFAILSAIRQKHRVLRTPMGVIVAGAAEALQVLTDGRTYSVRGYWPRMESSSMEMHLGMDAVPLDRVVCPHLSGGHADQSYVDEIGNKINYERESIANGLLREISREEGFQRALVETRKVLGASVAAAKQTARALDPLASAGPAPVKAARPSTSLRATTDLWILAEEVVSQLSQHWFGMPDGKFMELGGQPRSEDDPTTYCPADFTSFSQYIFRPEPDVWTKRYVQKRGALVFEAVSAFVTSEANVRGTFVEFGHSFLVKLRDLASAFRSSPHEQMALIVRSLTGVVDGFVAASFGSFLSVIGQWMQSDELGRLKRKYQSELGAFRALGDWSGASPPGLASLLLDEQPFARHVMQTLKVLPKPAWLHRIATTETRLGPVTVERGERVVVHLGVAALEQAGIPDLLFGCGSAQNGEVPLHGCPAKEMAIGVLLGMVAAILELKNPDVAGTLTLSFDVS